MYQEWLTQLKQIWETKQIEKLPKIMADTFVYYEHPSKSPITTLDGLMNAWQDVSEDQEKIKVKIDIITRSEAMCIAHWHAQFFKKSTQKEHEYDGIYQLELNSDGECIFFKQWWVAVA